MDHKFSKDSIEFQFAEFSLFFSGSLIPTQLLQLLWLWIESLAGVLVLFQLHEFKVQVTFDFSFTYGNPHNLSSSKKRPDDEQKKKLISKHQTEFQLNTFNLVLSTTSYFKDELQKNTLFISVSP